ncbi:MAG TPA: polysaccharide deacetylase, partial [Limnochordia bacterium]|nr:polysaccharide deacetylase [Limnochordia bacterium]
VEGLSGDALIKKVEPAIAAGHWAIFCFHGIGGDHIRIETAAFEALVQFLKAQAHAVWTETVQAVGAHLAGRRALDTP